jgi:hypothetical protein
MPTEFALLHLIRLKGLLKPDVASEIMLAPEPELSAGLAGLSAAGLAIERTGRVGGWGLTGPGRERHAELLATERKERHGHTGLLALHQEFVPLNALVKAAVSEWQLVGADEARRDRVRAAMAAQHETATDLTARMAVELERMSRYGPRLAAAKARFDEGDDSALTRPLSESYHDIWMELHQDLLLTLDIPRGTEDA